MPQQAAVGAPRRSFGRVLVATGAFRQVVFSGLLEASEGSRGKVLRRLGGFTAPGINSTVAWNGALIRRGVGEITGRCDAIKAFVF